MAFLGQAFGGQQFNAAEVEPSAPMEVLPAGEYPAAMVASDMKPTKNAGGEFLECTFQVLDGEYKGRKLWSRLNLVNANQQAVDIARRELSAICHATGVMQIQDSVQLHDRPLIVVVKVTKDKNDASVVRNEISGYKPFGGAGMAASPQRAGQQATPPRRVAQTTEQRAQPQATTQQQAAPEPQQQNGAAAPEAAQQAAPRRPAWQRNRAS